MTPKAAAVKAAADHHRFDHTKFSPVSEGVVWHVQCAIAVGIAFAAAVALRRCLWQRVNIDAKKPRSTHASMLSRLLFPVWLAGV